MDTPQKRIEKGKSVKVVARVRPFIPGELEQRCIHQTGTEIVLHPPECPEERQHFGFDQCYDNVSQDDLFENHIRPILKSVVDGFNATVFCYGVTGSGKTYTMDGLLPRTASHCLDVPDLKLIASSFQILNERVLDLLDPNQTELPVRENAEGQVVLPGATQVYVQSIEGFEHLLCKSTANRATAHTNTNTASSRSHAVLRLQLRREKTCGVLNLIDLAGSEDNRITGNTGMKPAVSRVLLI